MRLMLNYKKVQFDVNFFHIFVRLMPYSISSTADFTRLLFGGAVATADERIGEKLMFNFGAKMKLHTHTHTLRARCSSTRLVACIIYNPQRKMLLFSYAHTHTHTRAGPIALHEYVLFSLSTTHSFCTIVTCMIQADCSHLSK